MNTCRSNKDIGYAEQRVSGVGGVVAVILQCLVIMKKMFKWVESSLPCVIRINKDIGCDVERMDAIGVIYRHLL